MTTSSRQPTKSFLLRDPSIKSLLSFGTPPIKNCFGFNEASGIAKGAE